MRGCPGACSGGQAGRRVRGAGGRLQIPATFRERRLKEGESSVLEHVFQQA